MNHPGGKMLGKRTVKIDAFPEAAFRYLRYDAIVCIDVIRATTTAVTAVAQGRRVFPKASVEDAFVTAERLEDPLLAGEIKEVLPEGFEMQHSPASLARRVDVHRPMVLVSSSGTHLIVNSSPLGSEDAPDVYLACLRNMTATAEALATRHERVALLGAGTKGEFRCEDQMGAAWIAAKLLARGFEPEDDSTGQLVERWSHADVTLIAWGNSADYLRRTNQLDDLEFVMQHVDDLDLVCRYERGEVMRVGSDRGPVAEGTGAKPAAPGRLAVTNPASA
jgi:2-phosphosulfolactate phosphatase